MRGGDGECGGGGRGDEGSGKEKEVLAVGRSLVCVQTRVSCCFQGGCLLFAEEGGKKERMLELFVGCLASQQYASVSQGRICLTSQQHAGVSQGRICLTSQQHASVSQGRICSDNFTSYHAEIEDADQTFYLTQPQYTDTGPTSPSADPIMPGAWQGSHRSVNCEVTGMTRP